MWALPLPDSVAMVNVGSEPGLSAVGVSVPQGGSGLPPGQAGFEQPSGSGGAVLPLSGPCSPSSPAGQRYTRLDTLEGQSTLPECPPPDLYPPCRLLLSVLMPRSQECSIDRGFEQQNCVLSSISPRDAPKSSLTPLSKSHVYKRQSAMNMGTIATRCLHSV